MASILITSVGATAQENLARSILQEGGSRHTVVGCDTNPRHLLSVTEVLKYIEQVPRFDADDFNERFISILRHYNITHVVPLFEHEAITLNGLIDEYKLPSVQIVGCSTKVYERFLTKRLQSAELVKLGLPNSQYLAAGELEADHAYVLKPDHGFGSSGVRFLMGAEISRQAIGSETLIQRKLTGPETTVEICSLPGGIHCVSRQRLETRGGICTKGLVYHDGPLESIARSFAEQIQLPPVSNMQFMLDPETLTPVITDVNLRIAGGSGLTRAAGWDVFSVISSLIAGETHPEQHLNAVLPAYVVRRFVEVVTTNDVNSDQ